MTRSGLPKVMALEITYTRLDGSTFHAMGTDTLFYVDGRRSYINTMWDIFDHAQVITGCYPYGGTEDYLKITLDGYTTLEGSDDKTIHQFSGHGTWRGPITLACNSLLDSSYVA